MRVRPFARWAIAVIAGLGGLAFCLSQAERAGRPIEPEACFPYLSTLVQTLRTIDEFYVDEVDMGKLLKHGTRRLVSGLDARSTVVFADEGRQPQADVGLNVMWAGGVFVVISCESNSPSADSEIRPGDRIVAINGHSVRDWTLEELQRSLQDDSESEVLVTVYGPDDFKAKEAKLKRQVYAESPADYVLGEDGILRFRVRRFADRVSDTFKEALSSIGASRLKGIIIDVRDNIGGSIWEVTNICSRFVSSGTIFVQSSTSGEKKVERDDSVTAMRELVPVVVLVNQRTVGEAEVLAACLRGHGIARLVGERTFGFALGTECIATSDGTKLTLSTSEYLGPSGQKVHKMGLGPDVAVLTKGDAQEDNQLQAARDAILNWAPIEDAAPTSEKAAA
ncbi:MAG: PDZ domain-containing protein [Candidatus Coatesbacteria bacterium]|nr:PDZ domain-containing protein [Candidatus Coatesbacteria bacterium]